MAMIESLRQKARGVARGSTQTRLARLEEDVEECRAINIRLAELTDLVTELLLPVAQRDETKLGELLDRYRESL
ncbi:MAG TPA: DUF6752 domain-containing protein [Nocardioides sp.]|jgi:hypothetical protein|nr:DUF6752 domain-containing protein [Nocardioides sp.]